MLKRMALSAAVATMAGTLAVWLGRSIDMPATGATAEVFLTQSVSAVLFALGCAIALWYALAAAALLVGDVMSALGTAPTALLRQLERFGPPLLRRVATLATISAVAASPAWASPIDDSAPESVTSSSDPSGPGRNASFLVDLGWAAAPPAPPPPEPIASTQAPPPPVPTESSTPATITTVTVVAGDTLWGIAQAHLEGTDPDHTPSDIARQWPRWHRHNAETIGPDPDLLHPGMTLQAPPLEES